MKQLINLFLCLGVFLSSCQKDLESKSSDSEQFASDSTLYHNMSVNGERIIIKQQGDKYYFSEDEVLSARQFNYLKHLSNSNLDSSQRSTIITDLARTWTNGVVYYKISYPAKESEIRQAMDHIAIRTKIRFVERTSQGDYVEFIESLIPNISSSEQIGREGGRNYLRISPVAPKGTIVHEILHALGVLHEQTRSDRNNYVNINYNNMDNDPNVHYQFNVWPGASPNGSFDFQSIMLYGSTHRSNNGLPTITKLNGDTIVSQRVAMTTGDVNGINSLYGTGPIINGADNFCNSSNYSLGGVLSGSSVNWSVVPSGVATVTSNGAAATLTKVSSYTGNTTVILQATLSKGNEIYRIQKVVRVGGDINVGEIWTQSATNSTNINMPLPFVVGFSDRCAAQTAEWEVTPSSASISYNSGFACLNDNNTGVTITFHVPGNYTVKSRVRNACGFWTNWAFKTIRAN